MAETNFIIVSEEDFLERLDKFLFRRFEGKQSRTYFQRLIEDGLVLVNGEPVKKRVQPRVGDEIEVEFAATPEISLEPEDIPLTVLYEDEALLAIDKPPGMVVHPAPGHWTGTFVNALLYHCRIEGGGDLRPGIVHRLDRETSGVLIAAKTVEVQRRLVEMFSRREVKKEYLAICVGNPGSGTVDAAIGRHPKNRQMMAVVPTGRAAVTGYTTLASDGTLSVVKAQPLTGRTHQIRVHMKQVGAPVLGDAVYGSKAVNERFGVTRQLLHAYRINFQHPVTGVTLTLQAPIPQDILSYIANIAPGLVV